MEAKPYGFQEIIVKKIIVSAFLSRFGLLKS